MYYTDWQEDWSVGKTTGVAKGGGGAQRGPCPPPPLDQRVKTKGEGKGIGNWSMPLHKLPLIMAFMSKKMSGVFIHEVSTNLPTVGGGNNTLPPFGGFAPSLWPPLTNPGCTTVTGIAKGYKGPCPLPVDWSKTYFKKGGVEDWYIPPRMNYPLKMAFHVGKKMLFSYTNWLIGIKNDKGGLGGWCIHATSHNLPPNNKEMPFAYPNFRKSPHHGRGKPPSPGLFAPSLWPPDNKSWLHHFTGIAIRGTSDHAPLTVDWSKIYF